MAANRVKEYPAQSYCGCCGREIASGLFCAECGPHLRGSNLPPEERTYFAQHRIPCPLSEPQPIIVVCPQCGAEQEDLDGFGVLRCSACGYCTHPSRTGDICGLCGKKVTTCQRCAGSGVLRGMEVGFGGVDQGAECGDCEGSGIIVEEA